MAQRSIIKQDLKVALRSPVWGSWGGDGWVVSLEKDNQDGQELWNEKLMVSLFFRLMTAWE